MNSSGGTGHAPNSVPEVWRRRILRAFFLCAAVLVVVDFVIHRHVSHPWEGLRVFYPLFGFLGLSGLIMASKGLRRVVMRPEDYYAAVDYGERDSGRRDANVGQSDAE